MGWGAAVAGDGGLLIVLAFLFPSLAAGSRRLHDIGRTGWWQLLYPTVIGIILLIIWFATDTKPEGDKYNEVSIT